jgi:hypothetical protein
VPDERVVEVSEFETSDPALLPTCGVAYQRGAGRAHWLGSSRTLTTSPRLQLAVGALLVPSAKLDADGRRGAPQVVDGAR